MSDTVGAHNDLHSEQGARQGEHPGRSRNPVIKVADIAWLEFEKPDLARAEAFAHAFGFATVLRTADELQLRGTDAGAPCVILRRGAAVAIRRGRVQGAGRGRRAAARRGHRRDRTSAARIARRHRGRSGRPERHAGPRGRGHASTCPRCPPSTPHIFNFGHELRRTNATQRPPRVPARVQRLGHVVLQTTKYTEALNWYLDNLGMIVSDFLYYPGQRDRGPVMSFIRCDRGSAPADHHTLAMALGPQNRYVHSAYQVCDLDALAAGGEYLARARLFPVLGHRPPHPGQPALRLLARSRRLPGRALRRRRHVRQHAGARLGAVHRLGPGPVGPAGHQGLPRHQPRKRFPTKRARSSPHCATTTNSPSPACAAS